MIDNDDSTEESSKQSAMPEESSQASDAGNEPLAESPILGQAPPRDLRERPPSRYAFWFISITAGITLIMLLATLLLGD